MTPTPPETSSSGRSPEEQFRIVRKRNRVPLSCYPCRTRKKCDRGHPCSNCVKREGGNTSSCSYATPSSRKKSQNQEASTPDDMQNRIDRLEGLVLSLMQGGASTESSTGQGSFSTASSGKPATGPGSGPSPDSVYTSRTDQDDEADMEDDSDVETSLANSLGVLKVDADKGKSMYIGQEHWHLILADISEVKNYFMSHKKELEKSYETVMLSKPPSARDGPVFLLGPKRATVQDIRDGLPPRQSVQALCARYFNSMDNAVNIIHAPTFQQQLQAHWANPSQTCINWVGLLYSILTMAMLSYHKVGDEPPEWKGRTLDVAAEWRLRTVQCLIEADYTRPTENTVETMILYVLGEYSSRWDSDVGLWLIGSVITRIAYRMGYHRDPKHFPSITPFQGEMRRRAWALIRVSDVMFSHQVSLPSMIHSDNCDTQLPSNIFDEEFGPDTKVLPPSRPNSEPTPIAYQIVKVRLAIVMGEILQATTRVNGQCTYEEIMQFDAKLRDIKREIPPHLRLAPLEGSRDPVTLIIARFNIDILYNKIVCILHRKYLERARHNSRYAHSRQAAIEASLATLQHLVTLHRESQPSGRLRSINWYINSIATKDFLMPASLIVMDLHRDNQAAVSGQQSGCDVGFFWTPEQRANLFANLELTCEVWDGLSGTSVEAFKASKVLEIMLEKVKRPEEAARSGSKPDNNKQASKGAQEMEAEPSAAMTLNMLSGGMTPNTAAALGSMQTPDPTGFADMDFGMGTGGPPGGSTGMTPNFQGDFDMNNPQSPFSVFTNLENGGDLMANFDWNAFENFTQSATWGTDNSFAMFPGGPGQPQQRPPGQDESGSFNFGNQNMPR